MEVSICWILIIFILIAVAVVIGSLDSRRYSFDFLSTFRFLNTDTDDPPAPQIPSAAYLYHHLKQHEKTIERARANWQKTFTEKCVDIVTCGEITMLHEPPLSGVLGIHDGHLLLITGSNTQPVLTIPLDTIRWISHQDLSPTWAFPTEDKQESALILHCQTNDLWRVYLFASPQAKELAREIQSHSRANYQPRYPIAGPRQTSYRQQNIYGQWGENDSISVYLAPDRLLSLWHSWIELKQIQSLGVLPDGALMITYVSDRQHIVALHLDFYWLELLEHTTGLKAETLAGRKKKSEAE